MPLSIKIDRFNDWSRGYKRSVTHRRWKIFVIEKTDISILLPENSIDTIMDRLNTLNCHPQIVF